MGQLVQPADSKAWELFVELRKETIEGQKIRAQIIGFKITFVSSAIALILSNANRIPQQLLVVPAFAAICFDFLIGSYSFSIKRIGRYCRNELEPVIFGSASFRSWEQFMGDPKNKHSYPIIAHLGMTLLATVPAIIALAYPFRWSLSIPLFFSLALFLATDLLSLGAIQLYGRKKQENRVKPAQAMAAPRGPASS